MRAIKDCVLEISIMSNGDGFWWTIQDSYKMGINNINMYSFFKTSKGAECNWEKFAKLNKIKKWKYV